MDVMRKAQKHEQHKRSRSIKYVSEFFIDEQEEADYANRRFTKYRKRRSKAIRQSNGPNLDSLYNSEKELGNKIDHENSRFTNSMQRNRQESQYSRISRGSMMRFGRGTDSRRPSFTKDGNEEIDMQSLQELQDQHMMGNQFDELHSNNFNYDNEDGAYAPNQGYINSRHGSIMSTHSRQFNSQVNSPNTMGGFLAFRKNTLLDSGEPSAIAQAFHRRNISGQSGMRLDSFDVGS